MTKLEHLQAAATKLAEADHHLEEAARAEAVETNLAHAQHASSDARHFVLALLEQRKRAGVDKAGA